MIAPLSLPLPAIDRHLAMLPQTSSGSPRAALHFSLHGIHDGDGMFGAPTGAEVFVMVIAHCEFGPRGIRREWTLIDETAIWKQILLETGDVYVFILPVNFRPLGGRHS